ncbi:alpha/beta hydrolase [Aquimarina intermedia]|uniref:alpha/beta hydrolase n=1 Tax=Aquimarina intermedia TaxID=350814 RepID=UPI001FE77425|nr:alpha/beta hydrolase-fold protein [Aquimarina intermedia]
MNKTLFSIGETLTFQSRILNESRKINIYLPVSYNKNTGKKYPVIYLLDGSGNEDFIHIAGIVQFGSFSWINMIPETIVVGIENVDRKRDFTYPTTVEQDKQDFPTTGGSEKFITFIEQELQPLLKNTYPINEISTLIGQSLGGLLVTEILFKKPDLFDNYIIVSPSIWWDNESILSLMPRKPVAKKTIYITVGKEGTIMESGAKKLYDMLKSRSTNYDNIYFKYLENQRHGDALHLAVYDGFEKIFRSSKP